MKILLIEDDSPTATALAETLTQHRYTVNLATDGKTGLQLAQAFEYDLILLDLLIPQMDGITLCRQLRVKGYATPILLLTAKDSSSDRVLGLDAGADDYVVKPVDMPELLARIRALLRRGKMLPSEHLVWGDLCLDQQSHEVKYRKSILHLTPKESSILELFLLNPNRIFSRNVILDRLWNIGDSPNEETVTTHIKALRHKLIAAGAPKDLIETVYGLGYRLKPLDKPAEEKVVEPGKKSGGSGSLPSAAIAASAFHPDTFHPDTPDQSDHQFHAVMAGLWEQFKDTFAEQVNGLEQAAIALTYSQLTADQQQHARQDAHKLAGSLGTFGYHQASAIARTIELMIEPDTPLQPNQAPQILQLVRSLQTELSDAPATTAQPVAPSPAWSVLVIDDDLALTRWLTLEATDWNMQLTIVSNPNLARASIAQRPPDAILLDLTPNTAEDGLTLLQELSQQDAKIPVVVFTGQSNLKQRVEVARLGGQAFLQKPLPPSAIFQALTKVLDRKHLSAGKVLIVDDDPSILAALCALLEPWGLHITTLENPQQFWEVLESCAPDLLVLDVEMPGFTGIDLCRAVRNDLRWGDLPVLFLTAHTDTELIHEAFAAGADDYIRKPIVAPELVTRIISRLERKQGLH